MLWWFSLLASLISVLPLAIKQSSFTLSKLAHLVNKDWHIYLTRQQCYNNLRNRFFLFLSYGDDKTNIFSFVVVVVVAVIVEVIKDFLFNFVAWCLNCRNAKRTSKYATKVVATDFIQEINCIFIAFFGRLWCPLMKIPISF